MLLTISSRLVPAIFNPCGLTRTCNSRSRRPQIETLATPGIPIKRGRTVHRAKIDSCTVDSSFDVNPIAMTLLVEDKGGNIVGGRETLGR